MKQKNVRVLLVIGLNLVLLSSCGEIDKENNDNNLEEVQVESSMEDSMNKESTENNPLTDGEIEISLYFENYQQLVDQLDMVSTTNWQFSDADSYVIDDFYLEWQNDSNNPCFSMKNDGASYIKLYGFGIGNKVLPLKEALQSNGWAYYWENDSECKYMAIKNEQEYSLTVYKDEEGNISSWYLNNWPEGEDVADFFSRLKGENSENADIVSDEVYAYDDMVQPIEKYEYSEGEYLSDFLVFEVDGYKQAELYFWHNYGENSSDEDFIFKWEEEGEYEVKGNRSKQYFIIDFTPTADGLNIHVVCKDENSFSWKTGEKAKEWANVAYEKVK